MKNDIWIHMEVATPKKGKKNTGQQNKQRCSILTSQPMINPKTKTSSKAQVVDVTRLMRSGQDAPGLPWQSDDSNKNGTQ